MTLFEKLKSDKTEAFKAGDSVRSNILSVLISDACRYDKNPPDDDVIVLTKKFIQNAKETLAACKSNREDLVMRLNLEIEMLSQYLPKQLSSDEISLIISEHKETMISIPVIMNWFKTNYFNRYDGKLVADIAKQVLKK